MYCYRLTQIAFSRFKDQNVPDVPGQGEDNAESYLNILKRALREGDAGRAHLQKRLSHDPQLQQWLATVTDFVSSKWLLEQELRSRGLWKDSDGDVYQRAAEKGLLGVSFSGGGIRSATFNLGVMQALAQLGVLSRLDYLSSVSGGGYIHQFLAGWLLREPAGQAGVIGKLIPQAEKGCLPRSPEPIKWLSRYASYLSPARGPVSADTWTVVSIWMRNTILNQVPIIAGFAAVFCLLGLMHPQGLFDIKQFWDFGGKMPRRLTGGLAVTAILLCLWLAVSVWKLAKNLSIQTQIAKTADKAEGESGATSTRFTRDLLDNAKVQIWLVWPWLAAAVWVSFWAQIPEAVKWLHGMPMGGAFALMLVTVEVVIFAGGSRWAYEQIHGERHGLVDLERRAKTGLALVGFALAGLLATAVATGMGWLFVLGVNHFCDWVSWVGIGKITAYRYPKGQLEVLVDVWRLKLTLLPTVLVSVPYIAIDLSLGLIGRDYSDTRREWLARLRAWSLIYALMWLMVAGIGLLSPYLWVWIFAHENSGKWITSSLGGVAASTLTTMWAGWSAKGNGKPTDNRRLGYTPVDLIGLLAAPVTVFGLLTLWSYCVTRMADLFYYRVVRVYVPWLGLWSVLLAGLLASALVCALFSWRLDINEFSMLSFYRNRLTRCFLGATLNNRQPDPFTGFDDRTKIRGKDPKERTVPPLMVDLLPKGYRSLGRTEEREAEQGKYEGPFPIFCTTINLTTGKDLATQERKGASFAFTPLYSGFSVSWTQAKQGEGSFNGFVPTEHYAYEGGGIHLDTAAAISGAAANPNMGYSSNPALAFLMTYLNVRLGWWIANPRRHRRWQATRWNRSTPPFAGWYLLKELCGMVDDSSPFVNLSDGGHFENMGLYELVRRRCKYIIVCDAESDRDLKFEGMGTAIAKCRTDFGADIDLDLRPLRIQANGYSKSHCVVGTIRYPPPRDEQEEYGARGTPPCELMEDKGGVRKGEDRYSGIIVYMKSSLVGDEPADLLAYKMRHDAFPHDSTADQMFTETQFESYRRLGHHVALSAIQPALSPASEHNRLLRVDETGYSLGEIDQLFRRMNAIWYPPTPQMESHLAGHLKQYEGILAELRNRAELEGLETVLNDPRSMSECELIEWPRLGTSTANRLYAMQFANSLLDFMYTVYSNLDLAFPDNRVSPHADWWMCLFRRWCRVTLLHRTWEKHVAMYPEEFRLFARRELGLPAVPIFVE